MCFALVSRTLGMLAIALDETAIAFDLLTEAVEHADRIGAEYERAASRRLLATALIASGEAERAAILVAEALRIATEREYEREIGLIGELAVGLTGHLDSATKPG